MLQIALSLMLLFAAGLFFRGAMKAAGLNPGFIAGGDLVSEIDFTLIKKAPADRVGEDFRHRATRTRVARRNGVGDRHDVALWRFHEGAPGPVARRTTMSNDPRRRTQASLALTPPSHLDIARPLE